MCFLDLVRFEENGNVYNKENGPLKRGDGVCGTDRLRLNRQFRVEFINEGIPSFMKGGTVGGGIGSTREIKYKSIVGYDEEVSLLVLQLLHR